MEAFMILSVLRILEGGSSDLKRTKSSNPVFEKETESSFSRSFEEIGRTLGRATVGTTGRVIRCVVAPSRENGFKRFIDDLDASALEFG